MTISSETSRTEYAGNGATTVFSTVFVFLLNGDVDVILRSAAGVETTWVEGTDYTLTGAGTGAAGSVTATVAPASGTTLIIERNLPLTQTLDLPAGGEFPSTEVEKALDRLVMMAQQTDRIADRSLHYPSTDADTISTELPNSTARASALLGFSATGVPEAVAKSAITASVIPTAFALTLLDDANAAAARATLGVTGTGDSPVWTGTHEFDGTVNFDGAVDFDGAAVFDSTVAMNGLVTVTAILNAVQAFHFTGKITPPQITADQNNYAPTNFSTANVLRLDSDATRTITGLAGGTNGRIIALFNIGSNLINLANESASSTAANRFNLISDMGIGADSGVLLLYDSTQSRWLLLARSWQGASQSHMESPTREDIVVTPLVQRYHPGHPKAWGKANVTAGVVVSYNMDSVADNGVGDATWTITTDFSSADHVAVATNILGSDASRTPLIRDATAGTVRQQSYLGNTTLTDPTHYMVCCLGDQ